jgi:hypothetical protein
MREHFIELDKKYFSGRIKSSLVVVYKLMLLLPTFRPHIDLSFSVNGHKIRHYLVGKNINFPPFRMTERSIELALANIFIKQYGDSEVVEVGAVTPYYWPRRVKTIVDPYDAHSLVTHREDWTAHQGEYKAILSISTFEHIGLSDYGLNGDLKKSDLALNKLLNSDSDFLVTWPAAYNRYLDASVLRRLPTLSNVQLFVWHRDTSGNKWRQIVEVNSITESCSYGPHWANTLFVLYRGKGLIDENTT